MKQFTAIILFLSLALVSLNAQTMPATNSDSATNKLDMAEIIKSPQTFTNSVGMVMILCGSLWAGEYEVTQDAYATVTGSNPSQFHGTNNPVDSISWNSAIQFCMKLTALERKESNLPEDYVYTLPTEAQWETITADASLDDAIMSLKDRRKSTEPAGSLKPNSLGLYDTRGNVMEFALDWHDPSQPYRVLRGGAFDTWFEVNSRIAFRHNANGPDDAQPDYGFRCVLVQQSVAASK